MRRFHQSAWFGLAASITGVVLYSIVHLAPEAANAPLFVLDAVAGAFFLAGVSVIAQAWNAPLLGRLSAVLVVYLLAVPGLWMLFGQDVGSCSVGVAIAGTTGQGTADGLQCRIVFGLGGLITLATALAMTWGAIRAGRVAGDRSAE